MTKFLKKFKYSNSNFSGIIYYSDYRRETVGKIPIKNPGNAEIILSGVKNVQQVKIYSKNLQPQTGI